MSLKRWTGTEWVVVAGSRPGAQGAPGPTGPAGPTGPQGLSITGPTGLAGVAGTRGSRITVNTVAPESAGIAGPLQADVYLNSTDGNFYAYSSSTSTWVLQGNIKGANGAPGATGPTGSVGPQGIAGANGTTADTNRISLLERKSLLGLGLFGDQAVSSTTNITNVGATSSALIALALL
jgi:hypothetical protein